MKTRSPEDEREMLQLAHASRFHWTLVGTPRNMAVGDWQISRIYAALNQPHLALQYAGSSLEICQRNGLSEILCTAYEAMARACAVGRDLGAARRWIKKAREQLDASGVDQEDREIFQGQIFETEGLMGREGVRSQRMRPRAQGDGVK